MFRTPQYWKKKNWLSRSMIPLSWIWNVVCKVKFKRTRPYVPKIPVICVGNLTMGGAGKTPFVMALTTILQENGHTPHIVCRGYGAYIRDSMRVNLQQHTYLQVGDEPLLLAKIAPTWAGPNRVLAVQKAIENGANIIVLDDGYQTNSLHKDINFLVIDSTQGIGNGLLFPAGPLRENVVEALNRAHATIQIGDFSSDITLKEPVFSAKLVTRIKNSIQPQEPVVAFCGIGCPEKFKNTLKENSYKIVEFYEFADHHPYTIPDLMRLSTNASKASCRLITTEKDWVRLPYVYRELVDVLPIKLELKDAALLSNFINNSIAQIDSRRKKTS